MLKEKKVYYENNISNKYKKIRKIILIPFLKRKLIMTLLGNIQLFIYFNSFFNYLEFLDVEITQIAYVSLFVFVIILLSFIVDTYNCCFKSMPSKGETIATYEYEFNGDNVVTKNVGRYILYLNDNEKIAVIYSSI